MGWSSWASWITWSYSAGRVTWIPRAGWFAVGSLGVPRLGGLLALLALLPYWAWLTRVLLALLDLAYWVFTGLTGIYCLTRPRLALGARTMGRWASGPLAPDQRKPTDPDLTET